MRYAPLLEKRLRGFKKRHCGEVSVDETYIKAIQRFFRKTLKGYEAVLWLKKGLGFKGKWTIIEQINLIQNIFGLNNTIYV